jgi:hypothetical protein
VNQLRNAVEAASDDGWAHPGYVGSTYPHGSSRPRFCCRQTRMLVRRLRPRSRFPGTPLQVTNRMAAALAAGYLKYHYFRSVNRDNRIVVSRIEVMLFPDQEFMIGDAQREAAGDVDKSR